MLLKNESIEYVNVDLTLHIYWITERKTVPKQQLVNLLQHDPAYITWNTRYECQAPPPHEIMFMIDERTKVLGDQTKTQCSENTYF